MLEIDGKAGKDEITFKTKHLENPINIKEPDVTVGDADYIYVKNFIDEMEPVLYSDNMLKKPTEYRRYIDVESFVEWYLINEIAKNNDALFYTSCYMTFERGGKLKMGPLWDFDLAFGGYVLLARARSNNPEGFHIKDEGYYKRLFLDTEFVTQVKKRYNDYYNNRDLIFQRIESDYELLVGKIIPENQTWGIAKAIASEIEIMQQYKSCVENMKNWIRTRLDWLYYNINAL